MSKRYVPKLSKNLLDMKFMKRSKEKVEIEQSETVRKLFFDKEVTESMKKVGCQYVVEMSYGPCEDLVYGRMSFRGANPEIEKMMKDAEVLKKEQAIEAIEKKGTISAEEMADRYSTLIDTMGKKFKTKRQRMTSARRGDEDIRRVSTSTETPPRKKKFKKPNDE